MRILHLSARSDTGGGPEMIRTLIEGSMHDAEHWIACPGGGVYFARFQRLLGGNRVLRGFTRIRQVRPDVIHSHGFGAGALGRLITLGSGVPIVHTFHGFNPRGAGIVGGALRLGLELTLSPLIRAAVAVSTSEKRLIERVCPPLAGRTLVIPNGARPKPVERIAGMGSNPIRVLVVGRLVHQKYPQLVAQVAAECRRLDPALQLEFRLAGEGPLEDEIRDAARGLGVSGRLRLLGDVSDTSEELARAHIYLSTARWEGLSMALLEAMHAGVPCVASRVEGNVDAIEDGRSGLLYDLNYPEQAARHIVNLARDPGARRALGEQARVTANVRFSVASMCSQYISLYQSAIRKS